MCHCSTVLTRNRLDTEELEEDEDEDDLGLEDDPSSDEARC